MREGEEADEYRYTTGQRISTLVWLSTDTQSPRRGCGSWTSTWSVVEGMGVQRSGPCKVSEVQRGLEWARVVGITGSIGRVGPSWPKSAYARACTLPVQKRGIVSRTGDCGASMELQPPAPEIQNHLLCISCNSLRAVRMRYERKDGPSLL